MKTVLVVEDNVEVAQYVCDIFEVNGYHVRVAFNGAEGWEEIQHEVPDVVVSDLEMPEMDGYQLLDHVRNNDVTETLPFILLTARTERENVRQGMTMGADDYVTKPFSAKEILMSVETMLGKQDKHRKREDTTLRLLRRNITHSLPHELRTPLQAILGYSNLLQMTYDEVQPDQIKMYADMIFDSGMRLQRLAENMLALAQIEIINSDAMQREQLRNHILRDPANIIEKTAEATAERFDRLQDFRMKLDHSVLRISSENLTRIVAEILDNAFKFSKAGSEVTLRCKAKDDRFIIQIEDSGRGMSPEQLQLIGAYMQFDRVVYEQQGMGMGLTVAKRLVELHGGEFMIRSRQDVGTTVRIELPV